MIQLPPGNKALKGLSAEVLSGISTHCSVKEARTGETLFKEGAETRDVWLVISGAVVLQTEKLELQRQFRSVSSAGDFFGELTLLGFPTQPVSAIAGEPTELMILETVAVEQLLREVPVKFMQNLSRGAIERFQTSTSDSLHDIEMVLGGIVHDLKNPISVALNAAEFVDECTNKSVENTTALITRSCKRMDALVKDVLDATRGKTNLRIETIEVQQLIGELEELIIEGIRSRGVTVVIDLGFDGRLRGDSAAAARALANIIKNAGEAMPDGGTLTIGTSKVGDRVTFRISDTGNGIPPQVLSGLFDPLVTFGKEGGSGFGMTITRMIAEGHGGGVRLIETSPQGTTFEMHLPHS